MPLKHVSQLIKCPGSLCTGSRVIQQPWDPSQRLCGHRLPFLPRHGICLFSTLACTLSSCLFGCLYLHTHRLSLLPLLFPILKAARKPTCHNTWPRKRQIE